MIVVLDITFSSLHTMSESTTVAFLMFMSSIVYNKNKWRTILMSLIALTQGRYTTKFNLVLVTTPNVLCPRMIELYVNKKELAP